MKGGEKEKADIILMACLEHVAVEDWLDERGRGNSKCQVIHRSIEHSSSGNGEQSDRNREGQPHPW